MYFLHSDAIWDAFPELAAGVIRVDGIGSNSSNEAARLRFEELARTRLSEASESEFPEVQAWRRAFSKMGLKPTQYRCASEALLRRLRQTGSIPPIHPLVDLCNAASMAFAIPVAVFDVANVARGLEVRFARGDETYESFSGETETAEAGEVIFADEAGAAHARRWTNRQSARSAIRSETMSVLIVAEALHASAAADVPKLIAELAAVIERTWSTTAAAQLLSRGSPRFETA